jgi:16S rRNA (uracil1498-N3)-methyltransferase
MQLFYTPDISQDFYTFSKHESQHCIKVLRKKNNDIIHLVDGKGKLYTAIIIDSNPKACKIEITKIENEYQKPNHYIHIAVAPTKNTDRLEWFLEKATEIGINEITPIICSRSERKVVKLDRLNKILVAAMKQSTKAYLPKLNEAISFNDFIKIKREENKFIANCFDIERKELNEFNLKENKSLVLIGPEGDFTEQETQTAKDSEFQSIKLGKSRLRTETAALIACHTINLQNQ